MPDHDETARLYGPWRDRRPADATTLLRGYPGRWWIAAGWAIEAFTGVPRPHDDVDVGIPRPDAGLLHRHVAGQYDVWTADQGSLRPLAGHEDEPLSPTCGNLWLRAGGAQPWEYDVILMSTTPTTWTYKRDARIRRPLNEILWEHHGTTYLRPEVQLLHKAPGLRPKDQQDFDACRNLLDGEARDWLRRSLETAHPGHPWIEALPR